MTNEELVLLVHNGENVKENTLSLYFQNEKLIEKIASKYKGREELEDLKQEGFFGLMVAVDLWSPDGGASFSTYAYYWIEQSIKKYVYDNGTTIRLPTYQINRILQYNRAVESFRQSFSRDPSIKELSRYMELSPDEIEDIQRESQYLNLRSTNETIGEDESLTLGDTIQDERDEIEDVIEKIQREELSLLLWSLVESLEKNESEILRKRYKENLTLKSCGEDLNLSIERVRQIEKKAIKTMRKEPIRKQLEPFIEDRFYSIAQQTTGLGTFKRTWTSSPERAVLYLEQYLTR